MKLTISEEITNVLDVETQVSAIVIRDFDNAVGSLKAGDFGAKGDILVGTGNGSYVRFGVGSEGQKLTSRASAPYGVQWENESGQEDFAVCQGRLTLTSDTPVTTSDVSGDTIHFTPYLGGLLGLYDGASWDLYPNTEISIKADDTQNGNTTSGSAVITALSDTSQFCVGMEVTGTGIPGGTTISSIDSGSQVTLSANATADGSGVALTFKTPANMPIDVFAYRFNSANKLHMVKWSSTSARATALTKQNGIYVLNGDTTKRYLGTVMGASSGVITDTLLFRGVWNHYNQVPKKIYLQNSTAHTYSGSLQFWNADSNMFVTVVTGLDTLLSLSLWSKSRANTTSYLCSVRIYDGTSGTKIAEMGNNDSTYHINTANADPVQFGANTYSVKESGAGGTASGFSEMNLQGLFLG